MILYSYSVFDSDIQAFMPPFFLSHDGLAKRLFVDAVHTKGHQFNAHRESFNLFKLGEWNDSDASFSPLVAPLLLMSGFSIPNIIEPIQTNIDQANIEEFIKS